MNQGKTLLSRLNLMALGASVIVFSLVMTPAEGIGKRTRGGPALKILEVSSAPSPFEAGKGDLTFSVVVKLPRSLNGANLLEISALISSPTQRSMRFISQRIPLVVEGQNHGNSRVHTTLIWNGRNQEQELVGAGVYRYEVRAKLMDEQGNGPRTKVVSLRSRGTVEVTALPVTEPKSHKEREAPQDSSSDAESTPEGDQELQEAAENLSVDEDDPSVIGTTELEGTDEKLEEPNPGMIEEPKTLQVPREG